MTGMRFVNLLFLPDAHLVFLRVLVRVFLFVTPILPIDLNI